MNVAFIGLGSMGAPMARNLIQAGHQLTVYNRTLNRAEPLQAAGAKVARCPAEAVANAEVLITMLGLKDNRLLLAAAEEAAVPMPLASLVRDRFVAALAQGLGEADWAAIARISYRDAGLGE